MAIPKGTKVRQVVPVIEGVVAGYSVDQESGDTLLLVEWQDGDGNVSSKFFKESEVAVVTDEAQ